MTNGDGKLYRVGAGRGSIPGTIDVGRDTSDIVATSSGIWIARPLAGTVVQVDPKAARVRRVFEVGGTPRSLATDGRTVWLAASGTGAAVESEIAGVTAVASGNCRPVLGGNAGRADLLIASDLPLQGDSRLAASRMEQAITFVLRERDFRAGRFRVVYQSCDDALPSTGEYDDGKCVANGKAFAEAPDLIGVVGSYYSGCTALMMPALNRAGRGAVPMVSPINSHVGLTRAYEGAEPTLGELYPTGRSNFFRVFPADDLQGVAFAQFAVERDRRRAFVLADGSPGYGYLTAAAFAAAAERLGIEVVGKARLNAARSSYAGLAARIRARRADAVMLSGFLPKDGGRLLRDLRAALGRRADIMVIDQFGPTAANLLKTAGRAARGVFISYSGVPIEGLPDAGRRFVKRFARTQPGVPVEQFAVYAAQATETLLDAIERSDGTRAGVLDALAETNSPDGLIGEVRFDERGDIAPGVEGIFRVVGGEAGESFFSTAGSVLESLQSVSPKTIE